MILDSGLLFGPPCIHRPIVLRIIDVIITSPVTANVSARQRICCFMLINVVLEVVGYKVHYFDIGLQLIMKHFITSKHNGFSFLSHITVMLTLSSFQRTYNGSGQLSQTPTGVCLSVSVFVTVYHHCRLFRIH